MIIRQINIIGLEQITDFNNLKTSHSYKNIYRNLIMIKKLIVLLISINSLTLIAQKNIEYKGEIINALDENNLKTGIWKLYDDKNNILIVLEFEKGEYISDTKYYKDSKLIASYDANKNDLKIYKNSKVIEAKFFERPNNGRTLVSKNGKELDSETLKYFFFSSEAFPFYYGGVSELYSFISNNINSKGNRGKVKVQFYIDANGYTSEIKIVESSNPNLDEEVKRVISILPRWQSGYQSDRFVKCPFIIPVTIN